MLGSGYLKLIAIACVLALLSGLPAWVGWQMGKTSGEDGAREEMERQVALVRGEQQQLLMKQQQLTDAYRQRAEDTTKELVTRLQGLATSQAAIRSAIQRERASNPAYYEQPVPEGGLKQWKEARELFR